MAKAKKKATKKKVVRKKTSAKKKTAKKVTKKAKKKATKKAQSAQAMAPIPKGKVSVGKAVPSFQIAATGSQTVSLSALKGKKVVLFFYPKDATSGCTVEGHDFTQRHKKFENKNTVVFGVSRDSMKSHENFKAKQGYSIDLLSDEDEKLCGIFGVIKMKSMYGRKFRGLERSTFVLDEKGRLLKEWRGVKVPGHAEEVLQYIKEL